MTTEHFIASQVAQYQEALIYVHDPMCSWCWGYQPVLGQIRQALEGKLAIVDLVGGLAPDTDELMPELMQTQIASYWRKIEEQLGTQFDHSFWQKNQPRRATYPACRAVLAAKRQSYKGLNEQDLARVMTLAIQQAYYLRAMNPSDEDILLQLADELGFDFDQFLKDFESESIHKELLNEIEFARSIGGNSFPSWFLKQGNQYTPIPVDYESAHASLARVSELRA